VYSPALGGDGRHQRRSGLRIVLAPSGRCVGWPRRSGPVGLRQVFRSRSATGTGGLCCAPATVGVERWHRRP